MDKKKRKFGTTIIATTSTPPKDPIRENSPSPKNGGRRRYGETRKTGDVNGKRKGGRGQLE